MTYFAITVGSKDASCIAGADRRIGDVHGGPRKEGGRRAWRGCLVQGVRISLSLCACACACVGVGVTTWARQDGLEH